jgi:GDP-L-fucose synthase
MQSHINVGAGNDISIAELAHVVARTVGFSREIAFDHSKPDGSPRKLMDSARLNRLGWRSKIGLEAGLAMTYQRFIEAH